MDEDVALSQGQEPMIMLRALDGEYRYANDRACAVAKRRLEQFVGRDWRDLVPAEDIAHVHALTERVIRTGQRATNKVLCIKPDGTRLTIITHYSVLRSKKTPLLHCQSYLLHDVPMPRGDRLAGIVGPETDLATIVENLSTLATLAEGKQLSLLSYLVDVCKVEATDQLRTYLSRSRH